MQTEIIIAGFGGQGVLFAGQVLAYAAMDSGKHVTWFPSYGPEMRGGTANCTVIVADEDIGSPAVRHPQAVICLNLPSLDKYEPLVAAGGLLVQGFPFQHVLDQAPDLLGAEGLLDEVESAAFHRFHRHGHVAVAGDEDDRYLDAQLGDSFL